RVGRISSVYFDPMLASAPLKALSSSKVRLNFFITLISVSFRAHLSMNHDAELSIISLFSVNCFAFIKRFFIIHRGSCLNFLCDDTLFFLHNHRRSKLDSVYHRIQYACLEVSVDIFDYGIGFGDYMETSSILHNNLLLEFLRNDNRE
ncbi:hypothetical protein PENTCL1PPCAC_637, partial [Pristionchus entomophagus]